MRGFTCLCFSIVVQFCVSHVILPDVLQNLRNKRQAKCGEDLDLEQTGGVGEIQLRTEIFNGTEFYLELENCTWKARAAKGHIMVLRTEYFKVEESDDCIWDYLQITEKGVDGVTHKFCGWDPLTYVTFSNEITLQFISDASFEDQGFKFIIESVQKGGDEARCVDSILGGDDSRIMNNEMIGGDCLFRIQATENKVITLDQKMLNFGSASCDEESIIIYEGHSTRGEPLGTICSDSVNGILPMHSTSMVIEYRNTLQQEGERFMIEYMFVEDNFTPAPVPSTTPSPVGGNNDCSGMYKGITDGILVYTAPLYEDDKECVVVVRNELLPNHVVQIEFVYFEMEESENCTYDSLYLRSGERNNSALLGVRPYCGEELDGKTFLTQGNSLRFEFKTDESFALKGFQAKISFVDTEVCTCTQKNRICIRPGHEKKCIHGKECTGKICENGGTCVKTGMNETCYCPQGFSGENCEAGLSYHISFIKAPKSRTLTRGDSHTEECQVEVPKGELVEYAWTFKGSLVEQYEKNKGFGSHPGGVLQIRQFTDDMEGKYSCFAKTSVGTAEHTFEYRLVEDCDVRIFPGPQSESKKINEMALLICHVDHRAKEVRWKKDGVYIQFDDSDDSRIRKMSNNYLQISNIELSDNGTYRCEAEDHNGCYSYKEGKLQVINIKPLNKYCGKSVHDEVKSASSRILKGSQALPNMHPWHVTFRSRGAAKSYMAFCGGTLISKRFVVTAAHCIDEMQDKLGAPFVADNVEFLLGTTDCTGTGKDGIRRTVRRYTIHPNYNRSTYDNDIAIVELDRPCGYTDSVRPICVEPAGYNDHVFLENSTSFSRVAGKVAGCGVKKVRKIPVVASKLQEIHLPYVFREDCEESLGEASNRLTDTMFCAGSHIGRTGDTCQGDSGGGLIMATSTRWVLTGIVSWAMGGCDVDKYYGVYTNVGMFFDWIEQISKFSEEEVQDFMKQN